MQGLCHFSRFKIIIYFQLLNKFTFRSVARNVSYVSQIATLQKPYSYNIATQIKPRGVPCQEIRLP
ncbi:hypothetical protein KOSB73_20070 [Klebsiella grimontii]|uniref:Uncharacterized protein n=1 Tax=Klebsiella grimontii TaxID=2058152 RepID=A0A285AX81_9ENTR|nr:hypothetical protein KOSB73_20070 [Klebsiella grimontii]